MRLDHCAVLFLALLAGACAKTGGGLGQVSSAIGKLWTSDEDQKFVSTLSKKHEESLVRLAQQRAAQKAVEGEVPARRQTVPPNMYRTTEPRLPEPDLSLPITDVPRSAPIASPTPSTTPEPERAPQSGASNPSGSPTTGSSPPPAQ